MTKKIQSQPQCQYHHHNHQRTYTKGALHTEKNKSRKKATTKFGRWTMRFFRSASSSSSTASSFFLWIGFEHTISAMPHVSRTVSVGVFWHTAPKNAGQVKYFACQIDTWSWHSPKVKIPINVNRIHFPINSKKTSFWKWIEVLWSKSTKRCVIQNDSKCFRHAAAQQFWTLQSSFSWRDKNNCVNSRQHSMSHHQPQLFQWLFAFRIRNIRYSLYDSYRNVFSINKWLGITLHTHSHYKAHTSHIFHVLHRDAVFIFIFICFSFIVHYNNGIPIRRARAHTYICCCCCCCCLVFDFCGWGNASER